MWDTTMSSDDDAEYLLDMEPSKSSDAFSREVPVEEEEGFIEDAKEVWEDSLSKAAEQIKQDSQQVRNTTTELKRQSRVSLNQPAQKAKKSTHAPGQSQPNRQKKKSQQQEFQEKARQTQEIQKNLRRKREAELQQIQAGSKRKRHKTQAQSLRNDDVVFDDAESNRGFKKILLVMGIMGLLITVGFIFANKDSLFKKEYEFKSDKYAKTKSSVTKNKTTKRVKKRKKAAVRAASGTKTARADQVGAEFTENLDPELETAPDPLLESEFGTVDETSGTLASAMEDRLLESGQAGTAKQAKAMVLTREEIQIALDESVIRLGQKDWKAVVSLSEKIIQSDPAVSSAFINRSVAYTELGMYKKAIQDCDLVIATEPQNGIAFNNRAYAYEKMDNIVKAVEDYEQACKLGVGASCIEAEVLSSQLNQ